MINWKVLDRKPSILHFLMILNVYVLTINKLDLDLNGNIMYMDFKEIKDPSEKWDWKKIDEKLREI